MNQKTKQAIALIKDNCCIYCGTPTNEDLRKWFGKGGKGGAGGGGWDRYSSTGKRLGKCGDAEKGAPTSQLVLWIDRLNMGHLFQHHHIYLIVYLSKNICPSHRRLHRLYHLYQTTYVNLH
jgi:hypothetical protein